MVYYEVWIDYSWLAFRSQDESEVKNFIKNKEPKRISIWVKNDTGDVLRINGVWVVKKIDGIADF